MSNDTVTVSALELRRQLGELINRIHYQGLTVLIERRGKIVAKIVPIYDNRSSVQSNGLEKNESKNEVQSNYDTIETLKKLQEELLRNRSNG